MPATVSDLARRAVRTRTEAMMTATVRITRGSANVFDPDTGELAGGAGGSTVYAGKARIRTVSGQAENLGDGMVDAVTTLISIPIASPVPHRDDLVTVLDDSVADIDLSNRVFRVLEVEGGSLFGDARRMSCSAFAPSRYWGSS